ncbi:MAG: AraC family transcriptional regulator [Alphaproteobacteria bacterium]|nr:AraC family transcriptional regulator [Alphaproteobacteria bacterium]
MTFDQTFSFSQALDLIGMLQCVFILSIIYLNAVDLRQAAPSIAFFAVLGLSFGLPAAGGSQSFAWQAAAIWVAQAWIPTVSYFLVLQVAMGRLPETRHLIVFVLPMIGPIAVVAATLSGESCGAQFICAESVPLLRVFGVVPGAVVMLLLWAHRGLFVQLREARDSTNRYWAVIAFVAFNVMNLGIDVPSVFGVLDVADSMFLRTAFGLTFVYLVTTLVFRIEPKPIVLMPGALTRRSTELTADEVALAERIKDLMALDKLYQEPAFSRADLARELDVSENVLSRVINCAFEKSFRKLLNDHRVDEAQALLRESDLQVTQIAFDVGFNSLASFNRVFKDTSGVAPTEYRATSRPPKEE